MRKISDRLIVGCGYVGLRVAQKWRSHGDRVWAITRSGQRVEQLLAAGIQPLVWNWLDADSETATQALQTLKEISWRTVLIAVSHAAVEGIPASETHVRGLIHLHAALNGTDDPEFAKWIYLSTTGVIGSSGDGDWVDESSDVQPTRPGTIAAANGEEWIRHNISTPRRVILRPAGIYGAGRVPNWRSVRDSIPLDADPDSFLNLIHVNDLASVVDFFTRNGHRFDLYCVSDNRPATRREYYQSIAAIGNFPEPVFALDLKTMQSSAGEQREKVAGVPSSLDPKAKRGNANKRVSAERLFSELKDALEFPSYREGLANVLSEIA